MESHNLVLQWWHVIAGLVSALSAFVGGFVKLQGGLNYLKEQFEKEISKDGRIGRLEKQCDELFMRTNNTITARATQEEINKKHDEHYVDIKTELEKIRNILEEMRNK